MRKNRKTKPADLSEADRFEFSDLPGTGSVRKQLQAQELFHRRAWGGCEGDGGRIVHG
jgi:hypothetical protein